MEYRESVPNVQGIEFQVSEAPVGATLTLVLDGKAVMTAIVDEDGDAEAEINVTVTRAR